MLTEPALRSQVDSLWDKLWTGGLSNPLDAIEQFSFLLFMKRLDEKEQDNERVARLRKKPFKSVFTDASLRWSQWSRLPADEALRQVKEKVFPFIKNLGGEGGTFAETMQNAEFKISKPSLLIEACRLIDQMHISEQNQDVQGDLYEYLLSRLNTAGTNGQFRTPRHIIRMMVKMVNPRAGERMCDPAAGTCGFAVNFFQHVLEENTDKTALVRDAEGFPHNLTGEKLTREEHEFLRTKAITAYDSDAGMTMLRIGSMNLILHGIQNPNFHLKDTLSKAFDEEKRYDIILANPPFKGAVDQSDVHPSLPTQCKKTEILFLHLFLRLLDMGGRAAVIVPEGILFSTSKAHTEIRRKLIEENRLDGVVSMPSGVFKPYAGVSTAVLLFTRGGSTDKIWFYDMEHDGLSLDDKRQPVPENDIPDILTCWKNRRVAKFAQDRAQRLAELEKQIAPLKKERLKLLAEVNRLTFEHAIAGDEDDKARVALGVDQKKLATLQETIAPLQNEINQLNRQFWVTKDQVKVNKYDLSASRYRHLESEENYFENHRTTIDRLLRLEKVSTTLLKELNVEIS